MKALATNENQIGPERVRRESPEAETLCAKSHTPGQRFHQNFGFRGVEKRVKTVIFEFFPKILRGGFFHIILRLRGSLNKCFVPILRKKFLENELNTWPSVFNCTHFDASG